ncbi:MAG: hypothetical protein JEY79_17440 [Pseudodesulfovibrio sp.]|nr:hypothetical protein [Pseudodesulfovibrio sp.]
MTIQQTAQSLGQTFMELGQQFIPDAPPEAIRYGGAAFLGVMAFILLIFALRMFRGSNNKIKNSSTHTDIPQSLQQDGVLLDLLDSPDDENVSVRCVITSVRSGKIKCEIIERLDVMKTQEGKEIVCVFAPMKTKTEKVNFFTAKLLESDKSGNKADRLILSSPTAYGVTPRRKHTRKRVADQQFIRVKLWVASPYSSDISFEDAAPQIGVNSFATNGPDQSSNAVVNISNGGLGLSIRNRIIPETCAVGASVAINLFMFNFKEKTFKPYWYSGQVRSMEETRPDFTRIGIEFNGAAQTNSDTGRLKWSKF